MKAAIIERTGGPEVIQIIDLPAPVPAANQVVIQTEAVAVNPIDTYVRSGTVKMDLPMPYIVGCDAAGIVAAVGSEVKGIRSGDRVWCTNQGLLGRQGTFAEQIAVDAQWVYPIADGVPAETAAACALVGITAHLGLFREGKVRPGHTVFVRGGSGGVGSMVIQMAKAAGAVVIATGTSDEKVQACYDLGADLALRADASDLADQVKVFAPQGVKLYWETARVPAFDLAVEIVAERGRIILMAGREARPEFPVGPFYVKGLQMRGFVMFKAPADKMRLAADDLGTWLAEGKIRPAIAARLPLHQAAEAHRMQERNTLEGAGELRGKIVLSCGKSGT